MSLLYDVRWVGLRLMFTMLWLVRWKLLIRTRYNLFPHCRTSTATSVNSQLVVFMAEKWIFLGKTKLILSAPLIVITMVKCKVFWAILFESWGGGRNGVNVHAVSWITCQTDKQEKNIKFWVLRWTKSKIIKKFSFLFKVKRYDEPRKGINWMEIISVHFFTNVISKTAKTFVSQKQWLWLRRDEREQQNELSCIHYEMR